MSLSPFAHTCHDYSKAVRMRLGKGEQQAALLYTQLMRTGSFDRSLPAFRNSQQLIDAIIAESDLSLPSLSRTIAEGETCKFLLKTSDGLDSESVILPMKNSATLCISSQVGCRMGCAFCTTGAMGLVRHLTAQEITAQLFIARHQLQAPIRNVVFMGMGEPFDNYTEVMRAIRCFTDPLGFGIAARHITLSTSGLVDAINRFTLERGELPNLAISVTAAEEKLRNKLMPINRRYPLQALYEAMVRYCRTTGREILIACTLLEGVNDSLEHAALLADYLKGLRVKINLIPYNPQPSDRFRTPSLASLEAFAAVLRGAGYRTLLRITKGSAIAAACGQLGNPAHRRRSVTSAFPSLVGKECNND